MVAEKLSKDNIIPMRSTPGIWTIFMSVFVDASVVTRDDI